MLKGSSRSSQTMASIAALFLLAGCAAPQTTTNTEDLQENESSKKSHVREDADGNKWVEMVYRDGAWREKNWVKPIKDTYDVIFCREDDTHTHEKPFFCPLGGELFFSPESTSYSTAGRYFDFRPVSAVAYLGLPDPMPVCPEHGFVLYKEELTEEELRNLEKVVGSNEYRALSGKHTSYALVAWLAEKGAISTEDYGSLWWLNLVSTWEAYSCNEDLYRQYVESTIHLLERALEGQKPARDNEDFWYMHILLSNLYRRTGEFEDASKSIEKVMAEYKGVMPGDVEKYFLKLGIHVGARNRDPQRMEF